MLDVYILKSQIRGKKPSVQSKKLTFTLILIYNHTVIRHQSPGSFNAPLKIIFFLPWFSFEGLLHTTKSSAKSSEFTQADKVLGNSLNKTLKKEDRKLKYTKNYIYGSSVGCGTKNYLAHNQVSGNSQFDKKWIWRHLINALWKPMNTSNKEIWSNLFSTI